MVATNPPSPWPFKAAGHKFTENPLVIEQSGTDAIL
jgi:hypothetical protein